LVVAVGIGTRTVDLFAGSPRAETGSCACGDAGGDARPSPPAVGLVRGPMLGS
jgi:hypothetical protein